ncbi:MAG TPA: N-acetyltransferase [Planctomycetaceae bacterium]|nr:N-acetyltransferase [Planctomycetaceae bacterium]
MANRGIKIRNARPGEAAEMAHVDRLSWPPELASTEEQFRARIAAYAEGQWVAEDNGRIVAVSSAQRISEKVLHNGHIDHNRLTDFGRFTRSHDPQGEVYQLIGIGVLPEYRWMQLGRLMIDHQVEFARGLAGIRRIVGFTRPVRYYRYSEMPIEEYVRRRTATGRLLDPVLSFHLDSGARLVSIHPNFRPEDHKACGYAVLIEYPVPRR